MSKAKTATQLANLPGRPFIEEMKHCLSEDERWEVFTDPLILDRTRWGLITVIDSIDKQIKDEPYPTPKWLHGVNKLHKLCRLRLGNLPVNDGPVISGSRETAAWRTFAWVVAKSLAEVDPDALEAIMTPFGGMNGMDWVIAQNRKRSAGVRS